MQTEKYILANGEVLVHFKPKLIRIVGSEELLSSLRSNLNANTLKLVKMIKADYQAKIGKPLKITNASLMVEIWGHLYASKFAASLNELIKLSIIQNITERITKRSNTIDCGEVDIDSNRVFWDIAARLTKFAWQGAGEKS